MSSGLSDIGLCYVNVFLMALFQHDRAIMDRAAMLARYFACGIQKRLATLLRDRDEHNDIKEKVLFVLLQAASLMDCKTYFFS